MKPEPVMADPTVDDIEEAENGPRDLLTGRGVAEPRTNVVARKGPPRHYLVGASDDPVDGEVEIIDVAPEAQNVGH